MENAEEVLQCLDEFSKRRPKNIPRELEEYLSYVARTGDPVYQWPLIKFLFKEKLLNVITEFYETSPGLDLPHCPNVDPFNYDSMKNSLMERIDAFTSAPFTVQRICELLTTPRKQYSRIDKFMRAVEKNILVVSTREPGPLRHSESDNGEPIDSIVNGSDSNSDYNVDVEMEDMSNWKENTDNVQSCPSQPSSSDANINVNIGPQFTNHSEPETSTETLKMHQITAEEEQRTALLDADNVEPLDQRDPLSVAESKCDVKSPDMKHTDDADSNIDSDESTSKSLPEESSVDDKNIEMEPDLEEIEDINAGSKLHCDEVQSPSIPQITIEPVPAITEDTPTTVIETDSSDKIINVKPDKHTTIASEDIVVETASIIPPTEEKSIPDIVTSGDDSSSSNSSDNVDVNSNASSTGSNDSGEKSPQDSNDGMTTPQETYSEPPVVDTNIVGDQTEVSVKEDVSKDDTLVPVKESTITEDRLSGDSVTDNLDEGKLNNEESPASNLSSEKTDEVKDNVKNVPSPDKPIEQVIDIAGPEVMEKIDINVEAECKDT